MHLSAAMRKALEAAARPGGLRRHHRPGHGRPPWPAHPSTIRALERHGLVAHQQARHRDGHPVDVWTITDQGRRVLHPPPVRLAARPVWLARSGRGDYTADRSRAIDPLETVDAPEHLVRASRIRHAEAQDPRARARRLRAA